METKDVSKEEAWSLGRGPFLFSGPPLLCSGALRLINNSAEKIKVRAVALEGLALKAANGQPLQDVRVFGRLRPSEEASVVAQIAVDRHTPPGQHAGTLRCGSQQEQALIFVLPNHDLRVVPEKVFVSATPGQSITQTIFIANQGNMTFSTRKAAIVGLQQLGMAHEALAVSLTEAGGEGHVKFLDRFVQKLSEAEAQPAKVKIEVEGEEIQPGETKQVTLEIKLPPDLKPKRTYTSQIEFKNATLALEIECNGKAGAQDGRQL
jgi:hypothetical protein